MLKWMAGTFIIAVDWRAHLLNLDVDVVEQESTWWDAGDGGRFL